MIGPYKFALVKNEPHPNDAVCFLRRVYAFKSSSNHLRYIVEAEFHRCQVVGIKFYPKNLKQSNHKFSLITNNGDFRGIVQTVLSIALQILIEFDHISFAFYGARTLDLSTHLLEGPANTQRFNTYSYFVAKYVEDSTFDHFRYPQISSYLLINRKVGNTLQKEEEIRNELTWEYEDLMTVTFTSSDESDRLLAGG